MVVTFCTMLGSGLTILEQVFFAIAWSPKVTDCHLHETAAYVPAPKASFDSATLE